MNDLEKLEYRIKELEVENKDLRMRLSAVKVITTKVNPVCSEKLSKLMESCEECSGETDR